MIFTLTSEYTFTPLLNILSLVLFLTTKLLRRCQEIMAEEFFVASRTVIT